MADFPTIIDLSPVPQRNQNIDDFSARADAFLGKLPTFGTQLEQWGTAADERAVDIDAAKDAAETARDAAIAARDAAQLAGNIYPDTATGLASGDQYFSVISSESNQLFTLYENDGGAAVAIRVYQGGPLGEQLVDSASGDGESLSDSLNGRSISTLNLAALENLNTSSLTTGQASSITTTGRSGLFTWMSGDRSSSVTNDPMRGVWIAPASDPSGSSGAWMRNYFIGNKINAAWFGADAIEESNNSDFIQAAIDYVYNVLSTGVAFVPSGIYMMSASNLSETYDNDGVSFSSSSTCLVTRSGVHLEGEGFNSSVLKSSETGQLTVLTVVSPDSGSIKKLGIDGSWNNTTGAGHGIFQVQNIGQEYCKNYTIEDVFVYDVASYGIGIQNGDVENLRINRCLTLNTGADGIDVKGRGPSGYQPAVFITKNYIRKHGRRASLNDQAGIDFRGVAYVAGNHIEIDESDMSDGNVRVGIRSRPVSVDGPGASRSRIIGNYVSSDARGLTRGYVIGGDDVTAALNIGIGLDDGLRSAGIGCKITDNSMTDCTRSYRADLGANGGKFSGNSSDGSGVMYLVSSDNNYIAGSISKDTETFIDNRGAGNVYDGGEIIGTITNRLLDTGSGIIVRDIAGFRTKRRSSVPFSVTTTGEKTLTIPHNIQGVTPGLSSVMLSLQVTGSARVSPAMLRTVDSSDIVVSVFVDEADSGGTGRIAFDVDVSTG